MKKGNNPLPALPTVLGNLAPMELPEPDFGRGLIPNFLQKRKHKQMAEISKYRAEISEAQLREVKANGERIMEVMTYGRRYEVAVAELEHTKTMFKLEEYEKQEIVRGYALKNEEQTIKNSMLRKEEKDLDFSLKMKYKDAGYDSENEDRE
jgi:hypothetical protein